MRREERWQGRGRLPVLLLKEAQQTPGAAPRPAEEAGSEAREEAQRSPLCCAQCGWRITHEEARTRVGGRHEHTHVNPSGVVHHFGCFSRVEGCVLDGPPSTEATWFPGHAWQVAHCGRCLTHLGWRFQGEGLFWGLLLARLRPCSGE